MGGPHPRHAPGPMAVLAEYGRFLRVSHTLFSVPFAYAAALISAGGVIGWDTALLIGVAVLGLRSFGMAWNNIVDREIDSANPRTASRPLVAGKVSIRGAYLTAALGAAAFTASAALLGPLPLLLAPLYLAIVYAYPYAKRMHCFPHLHLGAVFALIPIGGAIAVWPEGDIYTIIEKIPWNYVVGSALWVAGFDMVYSILDRDFDRKLGIRSVPACFGAGAAKALSSTFHAAAAALFILEALGLGALALASSLIAAAVLAYGQLLAYRGRIMESFNANLYVGVVVGLGTSLAVLLGA